MAEPDSVRAQHSQLFGQFIGSWSLLWTGTSANGDSLSATGELHFGWVLGGRAVQDIWIVPGRGQPGEGVPPSAFNGTTIRFFDEGINAWRSTWINPVMNTVRRFIGRQEGDRIVLMSVEELPHLRWSFTDIESDSFRWHGEYSNDSGQTWLLDDVMLATRMNGRL